MKTHTKFFSRKNTPKLIYYTFLWEFCQLGPVSRIENHLEGYIERLGGPYLARGPEVAGACPKDLTDFSLKYRYLHRFVNFRDSKLTRLLQTALGGNSKTAIVCNITAASKEETLSTLRVQLF